ncbi:hypothetical protein CBR_g23893 [Chara braunii]|uniref:RCK C-terminal domain-containing protein n=1 Tax=Chara braunii TaxID=69332 RepID=A0A388L565_CHABU|nr:hypothetical protein CBR_g23893 [Chara braunii]|eukprot:GBG77444.1 hypothetical protein CBR_g23893 [Chara braunii]
MDKSVWQPYFTLCVIGVMLVLLLLEASEPYLVLMGALVTFLVVDILQVDEALEGFSDPAMLVIAVLLVVAKGIEQSGGLEYISKLLFRSSSSSSGMADREDRRQTGWQSSLPWIIFKFSLPAAAFSAVLANVPLVCMLIPPIVEYGRRVNIAPSKMLMPLSFSSLLGGLLTIIGSATNIVVLSLGTKSVPELKIGFFEVGKIGLPVTLTGLIYMITLSSKLLPDRLAMELTHINAREYNLVLVVQQKSSLARKSVEEGGLCLQPGLVLVQIERDGVAIPDPGPDFVILPKDQLHFVGVIDSLLSLTRLGGLTLAEEEGKPIDLNRLTITHCLVEAVVASKSPMVNKQVQELQFRTRYNAAVVAVHRHGTRLKSTKRILTSASAKQELEYLGHFATPKGIRSLADKIQAIVDWPETRCTTDVRSFMGLAGYYQRFVESYSKVAAPLSRLQSPKVPFEFDDAARGAFTTLKAAMQAAPALRIYDPTLPTQVTTDASGYGIGAVLEQCHEDGWHAVEYFSQKVPLVNTLDDARKKELLAFVTVLKR